MQKALKRKHWCEDDEELTGLKKKASKALEAFILVALKKLIFQRCEKLFSSAIACPTTLAACKKIYSNSSKSNKGKSLIKFSTE